MTPKNNLKHYVYLFIIVLIVIIFSISFIPYFNNGEHNDMAMDEKRDHFISLREDIQEDLMPLGGYRCCLEKPCTYCIEKSPGHGEGATCDCLADLINGVHPCGECIGEIMEGHGNKYLSEYFARAIAEKMGEHHLDELKEMMSEKYDISIGEQKEF